MKKRGKPRRKKTIEEISAEFNRDIFHLHPTEQQVLRELAGFEGPEVMLKHLARLAQRLEAEPDDDDD